MTCPFTGLKFCIRLVSDHLSFSSIFRNSGHCYLGIVINVTPGELLLKFVIMPLLLIFVSCFLSRRFQMCCNA